jgi:hypothetical protein
MTSILVINRTKTEIVAPALIEWTNQMFDWNELIRLTGWSQTDQMFVIYDKMTKYLYTGNGTYINYTDTQFQIDATNSNNANNNKAYNLRYIPGGKFHDWNVIGIFPRMIFFFI